MAGYGERGLIHRPDDMRGYYLPGHRFWTDASRAGSVTLGCGCGFVTTGSAAHCIEAGAGHCRDALNVTRLFQREIILRFGEAIADWAYDPEPGSWIATSSLATALGEFAAAWWYREDVRGQPQADPRRHPDDGDATAGSARH